VSPVPRLDRLSEYVAKGSNLVLRQVELAPEQVASRRLARTSVDPGDDAAVRVAILSPRDWAAHVQWESMIAHALRLRGAHVEIITCGGGLEICDRVNTWEGPPVPCATCTRYVHGSVDAHGLPRLAIRDGWLDEDDLDEWPELDRLSLGELTDVVAEGLPLGRLVDIPVKWFLMGSGATDDPLTPLTTRRFLRSARRVARGLAAALDEARPQVMLLLNGLFFFESIAWELCRQRGIEVVTYERGFIKDTLLFRREAPAGLGEITHLWAQWAELPLTATEERTLSEYLADRQLGRRTIDRFWDGASFEAPDRTRSGRRAVLFTNLTWDTAVIGQERAFVSIRDWVAHAVTFFERRPDDELVIRIHPAEVKLAGKQTREPLGDFLAERFPTLPPNVRVIAADDPTSSYPLMESSDVGLVYTSTSGLELALAGTPVIVAGRTHYQGKGFTIDVDDAAGFDAALERVLADPVGSRPDVDLARRYAYLFWFRVPVDAPGVEEHIPGLARLTVSSAEELAPGRSAAADRICDGILNGGDFAPAPPD
jgi:hypothetical protein